MATAITGAIDTAVKIAPYIKTAVEYAADLIKRHKDRISQMRVLDEEIVKAERELAELKGWFSANNHPLPKEGGGILESIRDAIEEASRKWSEWKIDGKAKKLTQLRSYIGVLKAGKAKLMQKGAVGNGMASPKGRVKMSGKGLDAVAVFEHGPATTGSGMRGSGTTSKLGTRIPRDNMSGMRTNPYFKSFAP